MRQILQDLSVVIIAAFLLACLVSSVTGENPFSILGRGLGWVAHSFIQGFEAAFP